MKNVAAYPGRSPDRFMLAALALSWCCVGIACRPAASDQAGEKAEMRQPLTSFRQILTSTKTGLELQPGQDTKIPVRIQNPGAETWSSVGQYPVTVSYKWYKDGQMLGIEGERTMLPAAVAPNQSVDTEVRVIAPGDPGKYA